MAIEIRVPPDGRVGHRRGDRHNGSSPKGEAVAADEPIVEVETDKITVEVPAPAAGVLLKQAASEGDTVAVGDIIGELEEGAGRGPRAEGKRPRRRPPPAPTEAAPAAAAAAPTTNGQANGSAAGDAGRPAEAARQGCRPEHGSGHRPRRSHPQRRRDAKAGPCSRCTRPGRSAVGSPPRSRSHAIDRPARSARR